MKCAVFPENTVEEGDRRVYAGMVVRALDLLRGNGIVYVTVGAWEGRQWPPARYSAVSSKSPSAQPGLAFASGASLLPVFTLRGPERAYVSPSDTQSAHRQGSRGVLLSASEQLLQQHEMFIRRAPDQWRGRKHWLSRSKANRTIRGEHQRLK